MFTKNTTAHFLVPQTFLSFQMFSYGQSMYAFLYRSVELLLGKNILKLLCILYFNNFTNYEIPENQFVVSVLFSSQVQTPTKANDLGSWHVKFSFSLHTPISTLTGISSS